MRSIARMITNTLYENKSMRYAEMRSSALLDCMSLRLCQKRDQYTFFFIRTSKFDLRLKVLNQKLF